MVNRSIHIPTELDERVLEHTTAEDSYSSVVQDALELWLETKGNPDNGGSGPPVEAD